MRLFLSSDKELIAGLRIARSLLELLDQHGADWERVFNEFENARKVNTDAIADLAVENFVEMRDRVADPRFLFRKKVELALESKYPQLFVPKYSMVTFHRVPYATALTRGQVQDRMLTELCDPINRIEDLDWNKADQLDSQSNSLLWSQHRDGHTLSRPARSLRGQWMPVIRSRIFAIASYFPRRRAGEEMHIFCGHSLGLQPKTVLTHLDQELRDWADLGVEGHFHAKDPWMPYHRLLTEQTAELVGAQPSEVVVMNSLTVNLHLMMASFYRPDPDSTQDSGRAWRVSFRSVRCEIADLFPWI